MARPFVRKAQAPLDQRPVATAPARGLQRRGRPEIGNAVRGQEDHSRPHVLAVDAATKPWARQSPCKRPKEARCSARTGPGQRKPSL